MRSRRAAHRGSSVSCPWSGARSAHFSPHSAHRPAAVGPAQRGERQVEHERVADGLLEVDVVVDDAGQLVLVGGLVGDAVRVGEQLPDGDGDLVGQRVKAARALALEPGVRGAGDVARPPRPTPAAGPARPARPAGRRSSAAPSRCRERGRRRCRRAWRRAVGPARERRWPTVRRGRDGACSPFQGRSAPTGLPSRRQGRRPAYSIRSMPVPVRPARRAPPGCRARAGCARA